MRLTLALLCALLFSVKAFATANTSQVSVLSYSGTNVSTSSYTQIIASTAISTSRLEVCDSSGKILKVAMGKAGSETDLMSIPVSGCLVVPYYIPSGSRIAIEAVDATATSGFNLVSLIP